MESMPDLGLAHLGDDPVSAIIAVVLLIVALPFLVLGLVAGVEFLLVLVVLPFAVLGRVLLGRHWTVEVRRGWQPYWEVLSGDWQASGLQIHATADAIRRGDLPPPTLLD